METRVVIEVDTKKVEAALQRLGAGLSSPLPPPLKTSFTRAGVIYMAWARARFVRAARGDGTWLPLALSTKLARLRKNKGVWAGLLRKKRELKKKGERGTNPTALAALELQGSSFEILRDTGAILNSISSGGPGSVAELTSHGIRLGTRVIYAQYHQAPSIPGRPHNASSSPPRISPLQKAMTEEVGRGVAQLIKDAGLAPS